MKSSVRGSFSMWIFCLFFFLLDQLSIAISANKVPVVANHNKQIRLQIGNTLRLECPVHNTPSGQRATFENTQLSPDEEDSAVLYHWRVRDRLDYALDSDPRYRFSRNRRVLEVTVAVDTSDAGTYTCTGVTGFGKREVTFEVHVRDPDANLLCAPQSRLQPAIKGPCLLDPRLKKYQPVMTIEQPAGSTVKFSCDADGTEPIRYRWFTGDGVGEWIARQNHGVRGPSLVLEQIGREHAGRYTCQASNLAGSVNFTRQLVVTDLPSVTPKIVSAIQNHTFTDDASASLVAQVQCACDEPVIQWLKRVEPGEELYYQQAGATKISIPDAREAEKGETFVILGSWTGSPAAVDKTVLHTVEPEKSAYAPQFYASDNAHRAGGRSDGIMKDGSLSSNNIQHGQQLFISRIHLKKPLNRGKHAGKYIIMTMRFPDVKDMEYAVMYVDILQDPAFLKGRRILIYFLVPLGLLFALLGLVVYVFACRRRSSSGHSLSSSNERCILRTTDLSPQAYQVMSNGKKSSTLQTSSRHSTNSQMTGKQSYNLFGVQSPLWQADAQSNVMTNGLEHPNTYSDSNGRAAYYQVGPVQNQTTGPMGTMQQFVSIPAHNQSVSNQKSLMSTANGNQAPMGNTPQQQVPTYPTPFHTNFINVTQPPVYFLPPNGQLTPNGTGTDVASNTRPQPYSTSSNPTMFHAFQTSATNSTMNVPTAQSTATELSFDQYSVVSQSPLSSSTLTNHYTAPFGDYSRGFAPDGAESVTHHKHQAFHCT